MFRVRILNLNVRSTKRTDVFQKEFSRYADVRYSCGWRNGNSIDGYSIDQFMRFKLYPTLSINSIRDAFASMPSLCCGRISTSFRYAKCQTQQLYHLHSNYWVLLLFVFYHCARLMVQPQNTYQIRRYREPSFYIGLDAWLHSGQSHLEMLKLESNAEH